MSHHEISTAHDIFKVVLNNPQYLLYLMGTVGGVTWWGLHRIFATQETVENCKNEMLGALNKHASDEYKRSEQTRIESMDAYNDLKEDIRVITSHLFHNHN